MLPGIKLFDLSGRTAIVTGGSKGLGLAMAEGFASAGASVLLVSRHLEEAQSAAATVAREYGKKAAGFQADISQPDQVNAMVESAMSQFGKIDILVNSAGINIRGAIDVITLEQFQQVMSINVTGTWLCSRAVTA